MCWVCVFIDSKRGSSVLTPILLALNRPSEAAVVAVGVGVGEGVRPAEGGGDPGEHCVDGHGSVARARAHLVGVPQVVRVLFLRFSVDHARLPIRTLPYCPGRKSKGTCYVRIGLGACEGSLKAQGVCPRMGPEPTTAWK